MITQFQYLLSDIKRWKINSSKDIFYMIFEQGIWATILYRISRALFLINIPILKIFLRLIGFFMLKFSEVFLGASIPAGVEIGPGLYVGHTGFVRIHPDTKIGQNLNIGPGTILGEKGLGHRGAPTLEDDVYVGTGSKVLGPITIGSNVKIGANAVVLKDVPSGATVAGIPARVLRIDEEEENT